MNRLNELADNLERGEYDVAAHKEAVALLRAAAAEQVGTEWTCPTEDAMRTRPNTTYSPFTWFNSIRDEHNADLQAARLAVAAARKERDEALARLVEFQQAVNEADAIYRTSTDDSHEVLDNVHAEIEYLSTWTPTAEANKDGVTVLHSPRFAEEAEGITQCLRDIGIEARTQEAKPVVACKQCGSECGDQKYRAPELRNLCDNCICGDTPAPADDTRELVARLAEWCRKGSVAELEAIIRDAKGGSS